MKAKNMTIGTQLKISIASTLLFVVVLGVVSFYQSDQLNLQTETIYNHPLQIRQAIGHLENDILTMRLSLKDLMLATSDDEKRQSLQLTELSHQDALKQFDVLYERYLGPKTDIDEAKNAFDKWTIARQDNVNLALAGEIDTVKKNLLPGGYVGSYRDQMLARIEKIDTFAYNKANNLYQDSEELHNLLNWQLILLIAVILLLSLVVNYRLLRNINQPLNELTNATHRFQKGDLDARSAYALKNEFGVLTSAFNELAASIQQNIILNAKTSKLTSVMLSVYDTKQFFRETLNALLNHTGCQMAAIYLLSDDQKTYDHFASIGLEDKARVSFDAANLEGEFGPVLTTRQLQHIKNIPEDTRFLFHTVNGKLIPREIVTIPIMAGDQITAIISLINIDRFDQQAIELIRNTTVTMSARIEGVLAYRKIQEFTEVLERQNRELDAQKSELQTQTVELMQQNAELEMQKNLLDEASHLKTNFLSNMSHELRTPLNSVIALSGVLNRRLSAKIPEEEHHYLEVIERNGKNLLLLINDILDISRIEAGREETEIIDFCVNDVIDEVVEMFQPIAKEKNIDLLSFNEDAKQIITSDVDKFRHIMQNLISNAVKFTEEGKVAVSMRQSDQKLMVSVSDTGIGIAEIYLPYIFDEFRQADNSTSRKYGGTGLGLAIAKKYAEMLGGTISAKSILHQGSEFTLYLPLRYAGENGMINGQIEEDISGKPSGLINMNKHKLLSVTPDPSKKTVLLIEDSEPAIIQIKDLMEEIGYRIEVARAAGEAFAIVEQTIPDAIILDLMMPGIDGFAVLKALRDAEVTAHIPVLILTAKHITKEELKFLKRNHVHQLIQKGDVNRIELQNAVTTMLFPQTLEEEKTRREGRPIQGKPVVLVVEDNPDNMLSVKALLADQYVVLEATDGNQSVDIAKQHMPNLILMDIALPVMDGIEAFQAIRKMPELSHIPVIALTASAMLIERETILAYGFDAFIAKPIIEKQFWQVIREVLYGE
ncbi:response regulator [Dehalobacter sp. DCM]|uniref:response regulator n=1 Tax=Dehalobacter sp. DCM TaxID=2907827 RepID=UPI0030818D4F|nr:response regulator [Dehalobacter sp. DCM]